MKKNIPNDSDLRAYLNEYDAAQTDAELQAAPPEHVFSADFEAKMKNQLAPREKRIVTIWRQPQYRAAIISFGVVAAMAIICFATPLRALFFGGTPQDITAAPGSSALSVDDLPELGSSDEGMSSAGNLQSQVPHNETSASSRPATDASNPPDESKYTTAEQERPERPEEKDDAALLEIACAEIGEDAEAVEILPDDGTSLLRAEIRQGDARFYVYLTRQGEVTRIESIK